MKHCISTRINKLAKNICKNNSIEEIWNWIELYRNTEHRMFNKILSKAYTAKKLGYYK